jgi:hypothetical protein
MKRFIKEYRIELTAALAILLGVFLLVERLELREFLRDFLQALQDSSGTFIQVAGEKARAYILDFTLSDVVGWVLIVIMVSFIVWRVRHRFASDETWRARECPKCNGPLVRIHRRRLDRILVWAFLPGGFRYLCKNKTCRWSGLRHHVHQRQPEPENLPTE